MKEIHKTEEETLKFWKDNKIFEKSVAQPAGKKPKGNYIFYDGPPFITGLPHYATLLPSIVKDVVPRFWTMRGQRVERRWGWDCHGLPAENKVEQELGLKHKKDIEELGIGKFIDACKNYVSNVSDEWEWYIDKIARWADMKNAYKTMNIDFMESVIWAFKELHSKGLIYEGFRTSLHCPRCATPLSKFEVTMDTGSYKDITEMSVVIKFKLKDSSKLKIDNASVLAWTTTPWTLPGNLALAVGKKLKYSIVESEGENYILAKELVEKIFKDKEHKVVKEISGKDLEGLEYEPLFDLGNKVLSDNENSYKIYTGDFVSTEDGTGVVHIAPNFGEDDFEFGKEYKLPMVDLMDETGTYTDESGEWKNMYFKDANKKAIEDIGNRLFDKFNYTHSYPFCYRCNTPLIYKSQKAWYLDIDKIRNGMTKTNENINWVPDYFKEGRFKYNLETAPHWCLSRSRYWGTPIPVWRCEECNKEKILGSIEEIEKESGKKVKDLHKPDIDGHELKCFCGGKMKRIPEIFDVWFESGSMSFAQYHYPFERKKDFKKIFPADFIIEYTGQLRGWFYVLHVLSNALFKSESFKNVIVTGVLAGTDGRKMSKSYGNYPDPKETLKNYGGDAIRMYFLGSPIILGGDMNMNERDIKDSFRKNIMLFHNILNFYEQSKKKVPEKKSSNVLDKWIVARVHELTKEITRNMEEYNVPAATKPITMFIEDLSTWYVRLNRDRLNDGDPKAVSTLHNVMEMFSKLIAPFMPYASEYAWQKISGNDFKKKTKSVHLEEWPKYSDKLIDEKLSDKMISLREIISLGMKERDLNKMGLRWPLKKVELGGGKIDSWMEEIIKDQLNVKEVKYSKKKKLEVQLDFKLTKELEAEGYARELSRQVQAYRKKLGLNKENKIELFVSCDDDLVNILKKSQEFIKERTNSVLLEFKNPKSGAETFKNSIDFKIKSKRGKLAIVSTNQ